MGSTSDFKGSFTAEEWLALVPNRASATTGLRDLQPTSDPASELRVERPLTRTAILSGTSKVPLLHSVIRVQFGLEKWTARPFLRFLPGVVANALLVTALILLNNGQFESVFEQKQLIAAAFSLMFSNLGSVFTVLTPAGSTPSIWSRRRAQVPINCHQTTSVDMPSLDGFDGPNWLAKIERMIQRQGLYKAGKNGLCSADTIQKKNSARALYIPAQDTLGNGLFGTEQGTFFYGSFGVSSIIYCDTGQFSSFLLRTLGLDGTLYWASYSCCSSSSQSTL